MIRLDQNSVQVESLIEFFLRGRKVAEVPFSELAQMDDQERENFWIAQKLTGRTWKIIERKVA